MAEDPIVVESRTFNMRAVPGYFEAAATAWRALGKAADDIGEDFNKAAGKVYDDPWEGKTRDSFESHERQLSKSLTGMVKDTEPVAKVLDEIAELLRDGRSKLIELRASVQSKVEHELGESSITFQPADAGETETVNEAVADAQAVRDDVDTALLEQESKLSEQSGDFRQVSQKWSKIADGTESGFGELPTEATEPGVITLEDGTVVVNTGGTGDDEVKVTVNDEGETVVTVNGESTTYPKGTNIVVRTGSGDDSVDLGKSADGTTVVSGEGDDSVVAKTGNDSGNTVISGQGDDTVYAGDGDNKVSTGEGDDFVELGAGDNQVATGFGEDEVADTETVVMSELGSTTPPPSGDNSISTGRDGDTVATGSGDDLIYTGSGDDKVGDAGGNNKVATGTGNDDITTGSGHDDIYGGDGNDTIASRGGSDAVFGGGGQDHVKGGSGRDHIVGGSGDDEIYGGKDGDTVSGGDGDDYIDGQDGSDVLYGGDDADVIYGLDGDDAMYGDAGDDYLEGATGDDEVYGGTGDDTVSGGRGDDRLHGGDGDDVIYAGDGKDEVTGGAGDDTAYVQNEDKVSGDTEKSEKVKIVPTDEIAIEGSDEFKARMQADLDMLASSPTGAKMLEALAAEMNGWDSITIKEYDENNGNASEDGGVVTDVVISSNPEHRGADIEGSPPVVTLFHELAHAYSALEPGWADGEVAKGPDEGTDKDELQAAGIKVDGEYLQPYEYTENALRDELGLPKRDTYATDGE